MLITKLPRWSIKGPARAMRARRALLAPLAMLALSAGCQGIEAKQAAIKQLENGGQSQGLSELEVFGTE